MYNVFKRPMFKRGGSTQGTGIMSHVEPRVRAANGFGQFGSQFTKAIPTQPNFSLVGRPFTPSSTALTVIPEAPMSTAAATGLTGLGTLATLTPNALMGFYLGYGAKPREAEEILGMSGEAAGFDQLTEAMSYLGAPGRQRVAEEQKSFEEMNKDETARKLAQLKQTQVQDERQKQFEIEQEKKRNESLKEKTTYEASDIKSEVVKEANMIKELLKDDDYSKGELALLVAGALKEPGGINAKLDKARELALPLARKRKEEDRAITLAAYKLAKEKEQQQIKAGTLPTELKIYKAAAEAEARRTGGDSEKILNTMLSELSKSDLEKRSIQGLKETPVRGELIKRIEDIEGIRKRIREAKSKKQDTTKLETQLTEEISAFDVLFRSDPFFEKAYPQFSKEKLGYKVGGRVMKAVGGEVEEDIISSQVSFGEKTPEDATVVEKPVQKLSYNELRDRLPQEITDDVVRLLANSEEALQEFAYIRTQEDVNGFNVKYGVNLVIPPQQG
jgi:hypothetical protein